MPVGCAPGGGLLHDSFNVPERQQPEGFPGISDRATWFMIEYQGAFTVGEEGTYTFRLHSDDGSYLFIDGAMVIENDGKHKPESRSGYRCSRRSFRISSGCSTPRPRSAWRSSSSSADPAPASSSSSSRTSEAQLV